MDDRLRMDEVRRRCFDATNQPAATLIEVWRSATPALVDDVNIIAVLEDQLYSLLCTECLTRKECRNGSRSAVSCWCALFVLLRSASRTTRL